MKFLGSFTCADELFKPLFYLHCYLVMIKDGRNQTCSEICSSVNAGVPSVDEWNSLNLTYLHESCAQENIDSPEDIKNIGEDACEFIVPMEYNFVESITWLKFQDFAEQRNLHQAYYFCKNDDLTLVNLKIGTLKEARDFCSEVYTPKIFHNRTMTKLLEDLVIRAESINPGECLI